MAHLWCRLPFGQECGQGLAAIGARAMQPPLAEPETSLPYHEVPQLARSRSAAFVPLFLFQATHKSNAEAPVGMTISGIGSATTIFGGDDNGRWCRSSVRPVFRSSEEGFPNSCRERAYEPSPGTARPMIFEVGSAFPSAVKAATQSYLQGSVLTTMLRPSPQETQSARAGTGVSRLRAEAGDRAADLLAARRLTYSALPSFRSLADRSDRALESIHGQQNVDRRVPSGRDARRRRPR